jgi:hypothetical protein
LLLSNVGKKLLEKTVRKKKKMTPKGTDTAGSIGASQAVMLAVSRCLLAVGEAGYARSW